MDYISLRYVSVCTAPYGQTAESVWGWGSSRQALPRFEARENPLPLAAGNTPEGKQALLRLRQFFNPLLRAAGNSI